MNKKNIYILLLHIVFLLNSTFVVEAAVITWNGGGSDNNASNPYNWSGNLSPQNGDKIIYDGTSIKYANWDLSVILSSLTKTSGYTGEITKISGASLTIGKFVTWTGNGADEFASTSANWAGNIVPASGDRILFDGSAPAKNCRWDINVSPAIFVLSSDYAGIVTLEENLALSGSLTVSGGVFALTDKALSVDGYLLINPAGTIDGGSSTITLKGNWSNNSGTFVPGSSTVVLVGTNQKIYGNNIFNNLIKTVTFEDTLHFQADGTQIILNNLTLKGAAGNLLSLRSTDDGHPWYIDPRGARNISFVSIRDMHNINFVNIVILPDSQNLGNNTGVSYGGSECVCLGERRRTC